MYAGKKAIEMFYLMQFQGTPIVEKKINLLWVKS